MTDQTTLQTEVTALLTCALQVDVASVDEDLIESGLLDSLKIVELLVELEARFLVSIPFEGLELDSFRSVASIARLMASLLASAAPATAAVLTVAARP
jgi:D-alanine--poly(phosphoribitol) ligase subunit 2